MGEAREEKMDGREGRRGEEEEDCVDTMAWYDGSWKGSLVKRAPQGMVPWFNGPRYHGTEVRKSPSTKSLVPWVPLVPWYHLYHATI